MKYHSFIYESVNNTAFNTATITKRIDRIAGNAGLLFFSHTILEARFDNLK